MSGFVDLKATCWLIVALVSVVADEGIQSRSVALDGYTSLPEGLFCSGHILSAATD